jgi:predicted RNA-binding Zn-ribbon protein involved in translation (DUF1610 family)
MKHRLFNILSALSLLLCLVTALLWPRSIWTADLLSYADSGPDWGVGICSFRGRLACGTIRQTPEMYVPGGWHTVDSRQVTLGNDPDWRYLGFAIATWSDPAIQQFAIVIPYWFICPLAAILPIRWLRRWRQLRRAGRQVLCPKCGYDLRATPNRCPECGTAVIVIGAKA